MRAAKTGDPDALNEIRMVSERVTLDTAQLAVARRYGFASWAKLKSRVEARTRELAEQAIAFCQASVNRIGMAVRMLEATPELAGYSFDAQELPRRTFDLVECRAIGTAARLRWVRARSS